MDEPDRDRIFSSCACGCHPRSPIPRRRFHPPNAAPGPGDTYALHVHVDDLAALIRALDVGPAHLVGHSGGAYIALALALDHPERVRSLVLGEPPVLPLLSRTAVGVALRDAWNRRVNDPSGGAFRRADFEEGMRRFVDGLCGPGCFDQLTPAQRADLMRLAPEFRFGDAHRPIRLSPIRRCDDLSGLERPVFLVTGERSLPEHVLVTAELEGCLSGEAYVMIPETDHNVMGNVAFYNRSVLAFLRDYRADDGTYERWIGVCRGRPKPELRASMTDDRSSVLGAQSGSSEFPNFGPP